MTLIEISFVLLTLLIATVAALTAHNRWGLAAGLAGFLIALSGGGSSLC